MTTTATTTSANHNAITLTDPSSKFCIGNYKVEGALGKGSYSTVRLATDMTDGQQWAMKIVDKTTVASASKQERLSCEIAIMKALRHPNVLRLREAIQSATCYYLVLELATGRELSRKIKALKRFPETMARRYFQQLIMGLQHCHQHGVAHRDLKPENLLLDEMDRLKISDFGLAALQQKATGKKKARGTCGTPHYMAPEVVEGDSYDGCLADIWSAGVVLYVMLTGRFPFASSNRDELFAKIRIGHFAVPSSLTPEAGDLITRLLSVDPSSRPSIEDIILHPWFTAPCLDHSDSEPSATTGVSLRALIHEGLNPLAADSNQRQEKRPTAPEVLRTDPDTRVGRTLSGGSPAMTCSDGLSKGSSSRRSF